MRLIRPLSRGVIAAVTATAVVGVGGVVAATQLGQHAGGALDGLPGVPTAKARVLVAGMHHGRVAWKSPLHLYALDGTLESVAVVSKEGKPLEGTLSGDHTEWVSHKHLVPRSRYDAEVVLVNDGAPVVRRMHLRATDAKKHLTALLSPGDGDVVGVGSPVIVRLSRPVPEDRRADVQARLAVATKPAVVGAWHWISDQELHWRPPTYWKAHTRVTVTSDLDGLGMGHGVWGMGAHEARFRIGDSHISRVDVARHEMYVYQNRHLIKTFPISAGRDQYPTKNGVHITFEKSQVVTMDSATVGIPRDSPDGYYEKVYWDVRISYGGAFVHAAPWSVAQQGLVNVSHGCVNLSTTNATWFYNWSLRGDIVDVYNSTAPVDRYDPGMADWNMSWKEWLAGDAAPTKAAKHLHPPLPHDSEPRAPAASSTSTSTSSATSSPSPSPSPSARETHRSRHDGRH